ncbi:MAG: hypothetical protein N4A31_01165 [Rickettsiales bacterium]|jgi:hypothetical protein|nr:hypothetical protein [Rickettsiales bacterium]
MTERTSTVNRVESIYYNQEYYLKGTDAGDAVITYLAIETKERSDLLALRDAVNKYKNSLSGELTLYNAANELLEVIEAEIVGDAALTGITLLGEETKASDSLTEGVSSINEAVETAVGKDALPSVTMLGVKTDAASSVSGEFTAVNGALETAVGKDALTDISLFGVVTSAATSLSSHINNLVAALKDSLGSTKIAPETPVTVMSCARNKGKYTLDKEIYTTSNDVTKTIFNILECAKWADAGRRDDLYFTPTGLADDCTPLLLGKGFEVCAHYLHPNP